MIGEEIHVWMARTNVDDAELRSLWCVLNEEERARAARFYFDADRRRSIVARGALRLLLGRYLAREAADLRFTEGTHGKPSLLDAELELNVSHSGDFAAIAFAAHSPVGVDVEWEKPMSSMSDLAKRFFTPAEAEAVLRARAEDAASIFFDTWTAKESVIKAVGVGLSVGLGSFRVTPGSERFLGVENCGGDERLDGWYVRALPQPSNGYHVAVAVRGGGSTAIVRNFES
jgi:4'-phosphopantetheinyl transferase